MAYEAGGASRESGGATEKRPAKRAGSTSARTGARKPATADGTAKAPKPAKAAKAAARPYGREQVIESIIDATLAQWTAKGPAEVSLRSIAARAGVNYGLVYRHFGTKEAVIRAAMDRVVARSLMYTRDCTDLVDAMDSVLPRSTGAHARLLAWAILQYLVDDILPAEDPFLQRLQELAKAHAADDSADADITAKISAGSLLATLYGWRLFEPYLVRGLRLEGLSHEELDALIRERMLKALTD
jgi:AcrR family transcriptional regulator